jgi:NAD(P)-dependent dehydrogenase (short-subunit alcohol dehydrogenase family)
LDIKMFEGKVALVTGGTSGIGRATAYAFAKEGAKVVIAARRENRGNDVVKEIRDNGGEALYIRTDIRKPEEIDHLFRTILETYGRLDMAFNNAGVSLLHMPSVAKTTLAEWDTVMETNMRGTWLCMKGEITQMLKQGGGVIVNTASVLGFTGEAGLSHYCASKHGVLGLTKTAALEYARKNIRINAVCPGPILTEMLEGAVPFVPNMLDMAKSNTAMKRIGTPDEIAGAVLWLCSDEATFMIGKEIVVDGGQSVK